MTKDGEETSLRRSDDLRCTNGDRQAVLENDTKDGSEKDKEECKVDPNGSNRKTDKETGDETKGGSEESGLIEGVMETDIPIDKGYSWVICISVGLIQMLVFGHNRCIATLFVDIREEFQESQTVTSLTLSVFAIAVAVSSLLSSNAILKLFPIRVACVVSSILSSISVFVASQSPNIGLWLSIYVLRGLACGCLMIIPVSLIGFYFKKRRALASSLASMGLVVANIIFPPVATMLRQMFGLRGTLLLMCGIELQMIPLSMLLRPHTSYTKRHKRKQEKELKGNIKAKESSDKVNSSEIKLKNFVVVDNKLRDDQNSVNNPIRDNESNKDNDSNSALNHPPMENSFTSVMKTERKESDDGRLCSSSAPTCPHLDDDFSNLNNGHHEIKYSDLSHLDTNHSQTIDKDRSGIELKQLLHPLIQPSHTASKDVGSNSRVNSVSSRHGHHTSQISIAALGSLVDVSYVIQGDNSDEERNVEIDDNDDDDESGKRPGCQEICQLNTFVDTSLMKRWLFYLLAVFQATSAVSLLLSVYMPVLAYNAGMSKSQGALLLTLGGTVDLVTRPFIGWLADKKVISKEKMVSTSLIIVAIMCQLSRYFTNFSLFITFTVITSMFSGFRANLFHAIAFDYFGPEKAPKAFGFSMVCTTVFMAANHPIFGALIDSTGSHVVPIHYVGGIVGFSAIVMLVQPFFAKLDREKELKKNKELN